MSETPFNEVLKLYKQAFSAYEFFSVFDDSDDADVISHVSCHVLAMRELEESPVAMKLIEECGGIAVVTKQIDILESEWEK